MPARARRRSSFAREERPVLEACPSRRRRAGRSGLRAACGLLLCVSSPACSILLVDGPPEGYRQMSSFRCTEGDAIPVLDALWAAANGVAAANAWLDTTTPERTEIMVFGTSMTVVAGVSSAIGFRRRSACREARLEMSRLRQQRPPADDAAESDGGAPALDGLDVPGARMVPGAPTVPWPHAPRPPLVPATSPGR